MVWQQQQNIPTTLTPLGNGTETDLVDLTLRAPSCLADELRKAENGAGVNRVMFGKKANTKEHQKILSVLDENGEMRGTRVFGPVARELREHNYMKVISLAPEVL